MIHPQDFYAAYLSNHFWIKMKAAVNILNMSHDEIEIHLERLEIGLSPIEYLKTIKIDLLQSFYQSAETLFGMMHSLEKKSASTSMPDYLVKVKIGDLHNYIKSFRNFEYGVDYLKTYVKDIENQKIPLYKWLFYTLSCVATGFPDGYSSKLSSENNIKGIALTLKRISLLFNGEAHNSIKHGLRCVLIEKVNFTFEMPVIEGFTIPEELDQFREFKGEKDILMYYAPEKGSEAAIQVFVPINMLDLVNLIDAIHNLQHNLINDRDILFNETKPEKVKSFFFDFEKIEKINFKHNSNFESIRVGPPQ